MFSISPRGRTQRPARHLWRCRLELGKLEDRVTPAPLVAGVGAGGLPAVRTLSLSGAVEREFLAYDAGFRGGVRVATGDVNGDGVPDIVTAAGPGGGPHVKVFSGADGSLLASFYAYDPVFAGGVFVAAGDVSGDGRADVVTGADAGGGPHVKVFDGAALVAGNLRELRSFYAYAPTFAGGVTVAAADLDGDSRAEVVTGAGPGGGPHVVVFSGATGNVVSSYFASSPDNTGGLLVAAGTVGNAAAAVVVSTGFSPVVHVFNPQGGPLDSFFAYDLVTRAIQGLALAVRDANGDGVGDVIVGFGEGGGPVVRVHKGSDLAFLTGFAAFDPAFEGGVFVG